MSTSMLQTKFYSSLRHGYLKNALRHNFDGTASCEDLLVAARVAEQEDQQAKASSARVSQVTVEDSVMSKKMDQVLSRLDSMQTRLDHLETTKGAQREPQSQSKPERQQFTGNCYKCGQHGHKSWGCPLNAKPPVSGGRSQDGRQPQAPYKK